MNKLHTISKKWLGMLSFALLFSCSIFAQNATIGDFVWFDGNSNGIQDAGEEGMEGVFVILQDAGGADLDFFITGADGKYSFSVPAGSYRLKFANPGGVTPSPENGADEDSDSDQDLLGFTEVFEVEAFETNNSYDGGFMPIPPQCMLSVQLEGIDCGDDEFSFTAVVTGGGTWGFNGGGLIMAPYGEEFTFGPFPADEEVCLSFVDFDNPTCTGEICVSADPACLSFCSQVIDGGWISGNEIGCGPYNPGVINSDVPATGGDGELEYIWLASKNGCPTDINDQIFGATGETYNPPTIFQTMYYVRWSRRVGCTYWVKECNCVIKAVVNDGQGCEDSPICESRMVMDSESCTDANGGYGMYSPELLLGISDPSDYWFVKEAQMTEFDDGSAKILARIQNSWEPGAIFELDLNLSGRTFFPQDGSPVNSDCYDVYTSDWYYYTGASGSLTGYLALAGSHINVNLTGSAFQVGTGADMDDSDAFGFSGSFGYTVVSHPSNEQVAFNLESFIQLSGTLSGGVTNCIPDANGCNNNKILYVVGDTDLNPSDKAIRDFLMSQGYQVDLQKEQTAQSWDAMGYGVVLISATSHAEALGNTFRDVDVPVVSSEAWVHDDMGMTGPGNGENYGGEIEYRVNLTDDTHPTSAGRFGPTQVYRIPRQMGWGATAGDGTSVGAVMMNPGKYAMFAYETGDMMWDMAAPARRVGFFLGPQSGKYLAEEGGNLLLASIAWAINCDLTTETFPGLDYQVIDDGINTNQTATGLDLTLYPNPTSSFVNIDLGNAANESAIINIYDNTWRVVKTINLSEGWGNVINVNLDGMTSGLHFVQVQNIETGESTSSKLIIH